MDFIVRGLSFLIIPIIVSGILSSLRLPKKAEKGRVYLPKFFLIFGLIMSTAFLIPTIITAFSDEPIWLPILFFVFSLLGASFIIAFINCRVSYNENGFTTKNFFGYKRAYTYDQVTAIKENMHEDYIYVGKHRVMIDEFSIGGTDFIAYVRKRYRTIHKGSALPKIRKTKHDIFNGNVEDVFGFMFAYISVSVIIIAFIIALIWFIYLTPYTVDNTMEQQLSFVSCVTEDAEIVLTSSDDKLYKIRFSSEYFDAEKIRSICDSKTVITTYSREITPDNGENYYSIKALLNGDTYLLSFEETNRQHQKENSPLLLFSMFFTILWGAYIAGSIIVGRNPKKFSKKIIRLFFKDGYVKY